MTDYEVTKNDDEHITQCFRDLSMNTQNNNILEPKSFYIKLEQFQNFFGQLKDLGSIKVVNKLVNNAFKYQIVMLWPRDPSRDFVSHHNNIPLSLPITLIYHPVPNGSLF